MTQKMTEKKAIDLFAVADSLAAIASDDSGDSPLTVREREILNEATDVLLALDTIRWERLMEERGWKVATPLPESSMSTPAHRRLLFGYQPSPDSEPRG